MQFSIIDDDGFQRYAGLDEIRQALAITQPDVLLHDDFTALSIEDGQAPTIGARYADSFVGWGVRRLKNPPNLDQGIKRFVPGQTHVITDDGLLLRSYANPDESTGFTAAAITTERSLAFTYGRVDVVMKIGAYPPGVHKTWWMMPLSGGGHPEFDIIESVSSNHLGSPVNAHFMNAKDGTKGIDHFEWQSLPGDYLHEFHKYSLIWTRDDLVWLRDDVEVKRVQNFHHEPMYVMFTDEIGPSQNGEFPGPLDDPLPENWETTTAIKSLSVTSV